MPETACGALSAHRSRDCTPSSGPALRLRFTVVSEPLFALDAFAPAPLSEDDVRDPRKANGVHYTPSILASFVARRVLAQLRRGPTVVLDPACGDGELLVAFALEAAQAGFQPPRLVGIDKDARALAFARRRLSASRVDGVELRCADFLRNELENDGHPVFDAIISNPPYVRTQVLGAARAQALAHQFGLTGRVDLYHAFVAAMTASLPTGGVLGLLCSNRFLTTRGGESLRSLLAKNFELAELWDLGDTKLFDAAVLPAVVVGRKASGGASKPAQFARIYEDGRPEDGATSEAAILPALESGLEGPLNRRRAPVLHRAGRARPRGGGGLSRPSWNFAAAVL